MGLRRARMRFGRYHTSIGRSCSRTTPENESDRSRRTSHPPEIRRSRFAAHYRFRRDLWRGVRREEDRRIAIDAISVAETTGWSAARCETAQNFRRRGSGRSRRSQDTHGCLAFRDLCAAHHNSEAPLHALFAIVPRNVARLGLTVYRWPYKFRNIIERYRKHQRQRRSRGSHWKQRRVMQRAAIAQSLAKVLIAIGRLVRQEFRSIRSGASGASAG